MIGTLIKAIFRFLRCTGVVDPRTGTNRTVYLANGRVDYVEDAAGNRTTYGYDAFTGRRNSVTDALTNTVYSAYDLQGRVTNVWGATYPVAYEYDAYGRFAAVTSTVTGIYAHQTRHRYEYLADSDLLASVSNGGMVATYGYEPRRDLRTEIDNRWGTNPVSSFAYTYDAAGRRTARVDSEATTNVFGYNLRSELVSALMGTNAYGYAYDPIGNRIAATDNGAATAYAVNELNQYTNIAPATGEPAYDLDGNLISDGAWIYSWDAENRMVDVSPATTNIGSVRLSFAHDYMSRRVRKKVEAWDGSMWGNTVTSLYTYDGWNLICEDRSDDNKNNYYVWGLDLSGTPQGAGGVGGLLARVREENIPRPLYYAGDANGNITDLVDTNGAVVAHYEYDPYGNTIAQSGDQADANPFRFSSKYWDGETGFYYYGYRYYNPELGRWVNRDPLGEGGGLNLYGFVDNSPANAVDPYGLVSSKFKEKDGDPLNWGAHEAESLDDHGCKCKKKWFKCEYYAKCRLKVTSNIRIAAKGSPFWTTKRFVPANEEDKKAWLANPDYSSRYSVIYNHELRHRKDFRAWFDAQVKTLEAVEEKTYDSMESCEKDVAQVDKDLVDSHKKAAQASQDKWK